MKVHILTAVTRPKNIGVIARSFIGSVPTGKNDEVIWHLKFDFVEDESERAGPEHVGGQHLKNKMLDGISDGWVYILDDDTILHPQLFPVVTRRLVKYPNAQAFVFYQRRISESGASTYLKVNPRRIFVGGIDIGMVLMKREFIGDERIPLTYTGDGEFLSELLTGAEDVHFLKAVLSYHNALR